MIRKTTRFTLEMILLISSLTFFNASQALTLISKNTSASDLVHLVKVGVEDVLEGKTTIKAVMHQVKEVNSELGTILEHIFKYVAIKVRKHPELLEDPARMQTLVQQFCIKRYGLKLVRFRGILEAVSQTLATFDQEELYEVVLKEFTKEISAKEHEHVAVEHDVTHTTDKAIIAITVIKK